MPILFDKPATPPYKENYNGGVGTIRLRGDAGLDPWNLIRVMPAKGYCGTVAGSCPVRPPEPRGAFFFGPGQVLFDHQGKGDRRKQ